MRPTVLLPVLLAATALGACRPTPDPDSQTAPVVDLAAAERKAYEGTIARLEADLKEARDQTTTCRDQLDTLRVALASAKETAQGSASPPSGTPRPESSSTPILVPHREPARRPARVSSFAAPTLRVVGNDIEVSGRLWNGGDDEATVDLTVDLLLDGRVIESEGRTVVVAGRTESAYVVTFYGVAMGSPHGAWTALLHLGP